MLHTAAGCPPAVHATAAPQYALHQAENTGLSERGCQHQVALIAIRGGNNPDVQGYTLATSEAGDFLTFNGTEDFHLRVGTHIANFIQKERSCIGLLKVSLSEPICASECPTLIAK